MYCNNGQASLMYRWLLFAILCVGPYSMADANTRRDSKARAEFQRVNPCPATGKRTGACPGYVVDHVLPLCAGGADSPDNMQWQTIAEAKIKDRVERRQCAQR